MDDATLAFDRHRPRLKGIAYRMLGSVAEAEDVVQDARLRWNRRCAKTQVREDDRPKQAVPRDIHLRLLQGFADAAQRGALHWLKALLAEDVAIIGDGGGKVPSFGRPVVGGQRVAQIYFAVARRHPGAVRVQVAQVNGAPGLLRWVDGVLESVQSIEWDGERIARIHAQRNPDKLARIAAEFSR